MEEVLKYQAMTVTQRGREHYLSTEAGQQDKQVIDTFQSAQTACY